MVRCDCGWEGKVDRHSFKTGRTTRCNSCGKIAGHKNGIGSMNTSYRTKGTEPDYSTEYRPVYPGATIQTQRSSQVMGVGALPFMGLGARIAQRFLDTCYLLKGGTNPDFELDRIDNDRGYCPGNLRFVSQQKEHGEPENR